MNFTVHFEDGTHTVIAATNLQDAEKFANDYFEEVDSVSKSFNQNI